MHICKVHDIQIFSKFHFSFLGRYFYHYFTDFVAEDYTFLQEGREHKTEWDFN